MGYVLQIAVAFFLSGILHAMTLPRDIHDASPLRYAGFFWIQGLCVLAEVFAEYITSNGEKARPVNGCIALLRTLWVLGVMYFTAPLINGELVKVAVRTGVQSGGPISFLRLVVSFVHSWVLESWWLGQVEG